MKIAYETSCLEFRPNLDAMEQPCGYPDQQDPNERNDLDGQSENPNQEAECIEEAGAWHAIQRPWKHTNIEANEQHWNDVQDQDAEQERQHYDTLQASHNQGIDVRTCIGIRDLHIGAMLLDVVFGHLSLETGPVATQVFPPMSPMSPLHHITSGLRHLRSPPGCGCV